KTVLMTALARKLAQTSSRGYFLDPIGNRTIKYIEKNWAILQSGDWPASTPPGEMFKLKWNFHVQNGKSACETASLQMIDAAGQDMRQLFSDESVLEQLPEHFRPLVQYMQNASILLVVLNIKDYIGEGDTTRKIENQAALKYALDVLQKSNRRAALIFTQMDQYSEFIDSRGGLENFCREELPYIYNAYVSSQKNPLIGVAAVNRTEVREMSDGTFQRVPAPGFDSDGLEQIGDWLAARVLELCQQEKQQQIKEQNISGQPSSDWGWIGGLVAGIILWLWFGAFPFGSKPPQPVISDVNSYNDCNKLLLLHMSHHAEVSCYVYNPGEPSNFNVTAYMMTSSGWLEKKERSVYIPKGERKRVY
ncbi:MAG: hypothetical protein Q4D17_04890, partial [Planctomycetia bacterium]|nr:hypothetical protein [Planctomycetia bacterium]